MIALAVAALFVGKYPLSLEQLLAGDAMQWRVFLTLRLSRVAVGVIGGFALGRFTAIGCTVIVGTVIVGGVITLNPRLVDLSDGKFEVMLVRLPKDMAELAQCAAALQNR